MMIAKLVKLFFLKLTNCKSSPKLHKFVLMNVVNLFRIDIGDELIYKFRFVQLRLIDNNL